MHWRNSNFQYAYFILGTCHTPLEAHRKCMEAIEDRSLALFESKGATIEDNEKGRQTRANIEQAQAELDFLNQCREKLEAMLGFKPTMDDYQNNQREEWRQELEFRAENFLLTSGTLPADHFATMRTHPDFPQIMGKIQNLRAQLQAGQLPALTEPQWKKSFGTEMVALLEAQTKKIGSKR